MHSLCTHKTNGTKTHTAQQRRRRRKIEEQLVIYSSSNLPNKIYQIKQCKAVAFKRYLDYFQLKFVLLIYSKCVHSVFFSDEMNFSFCFFFIL